MWLNDFIKFLAKNSDNTNWNSLLNYITARIDIINYGGDENTVELITNSDNDSLIVFPVWLKSSHGNGVYVQSYKGLIDLLQNVLVKES